MILYPKFTNTKLQNSTWFDMIRHWCAYHTIAVLSSLKLCFFCGHGSANFVEFVESILTAFLKRIKRFQLVPYAILTKTAKSRFYIFRHDSTHENAFSFRLVRFCLFLSNDFLFFYWQLFKSVLRACACVRVILIKAN